MLLNWFYSSYNITLQSYPSQNRQNCSYTLVLRMNYLYQAMARSFVKIELSKKNALPLEKWFQCFEILGMASRCRTKKDIHQQKWKKNCALLGRKSQGFLMAFSCCHFCHEMEITPTLLQVLLVDRWAAPVYLLNDHRRLEIFKNYAKAIDLVQRACLHKSYILISRS